MSRLLSSFKEWINPAWAHHQAVPPFEAGLRPNRRLDDASVIGTPGDVEPDDLVVTGSGETLFTSGTAIYRLRDEAVELLVDLGAPVGALTRGAGGVIAAIEGVGLVTVDGAGNVSPLCSDAVVRTCVTDLAQMADGSLLVAVGSTSDENAGWARSLVHNERSGQLIRVQAGSAQVVASGLGWPSGIAVDGDDVLVSLSFDHRIERRSAADLGRRGRAVVSNLPVYPGRIRQGAAGWWVAAPYARNRITELLFDEPEVLADMVASIKPEQWFVPRLRSDNPHTDPLQLGQVRVLGVVKPWAPPRSYGLVFHMDPGGRITDSLHSRADGDRHGVTGVAARDDTLLVAARGFRAVLCAELTKKEESQ